MSLMTTDRLLAELATFGCTFTHSKVQALNAKTRFEEYHALKTAEIKRTRGGWSLRVVLKVACAVK